LFLAGFMWGAGQVASAQPTRVVRPEDFERSTTPLVPENRAEPARLPERKIDMYDDQTVLVQSLVGVRFISSPSDVLKEALASGITIKDIPFLDNEEFRKVIEPYLGKPTTMRAIGRMVRDTIRFFQSKDRPVVDVFVPEQEITQGVVQLMVVEARVGEVRVEGFKWFSEEQIRQAIRLQPGDAIQAGDLLGDIDYINRNPFRFVRPVLQPGKEFGTTDVILEGKDRFPMRFYAGYEDTGSRTTGLERYFAGFNLGNVFNRGHEVGYQYTTNRDFSHFGIHSAYWRIPLANRDTLAFFGNYADYDSSFGSSKLGSINWMAHARYITQLPNVNNLRHGLEFGMDFRRADNNLQTGGSTVYDDYIDVAQFAFQYGGRSRDAMGDTSFVCNVYWSPCSNLLTEHQDREHYEMARTGSQPEYVYGHVSVERLWVLPKNWSLFNRVTGQVSDERLPPTEQLGLGGYNTVRGFDEREVNSDQGLMATVELRTPEIDLGIEDKAKNLPSFLQFIAFFDYGYARNRGSSAYEIKTEDMLSVGAGVRIRISDNVTVRFDYGHKLEDVAGSKSGDGRVHLFVLVSY